MRGRVSSLLDRSGFIEGVLRLRARYGSPYLTVLTYHRVFDPPKDYPYDKGVIDVGPEDFSAQLKTLKRYFNVIGIDELCAHVAGEESLPDNAAMITFDDGYLDNLEVAAPILKEHGMRAVFFIATSYIENRRIYWWDRINYLLSQADPGRKQLELSYPSRLRLDLENDRESALQTLLHLMKMQFGLDTERMLDGLAEQLEVPWSLEIERDLSDGFVMTWDDVRALRAMGMDVQSHTRTHRPLQTVPLKELASELKGSKEDLERELGEEIHAISYPIGRSIASLEPIIAAVSDAGYKLGFSNDSGAQPLWGNMNRYDINRLAMEPQYTGSRFRAVLALPQLGE